jgi:hypothetical protein
MTDALISKELLEQGFGQGPDYKVFTNAIELADEQNASPILRMVGSSTTQDLQEDRMDMTALQDMTSVPNNLTIWLNHSYTLPDDVFGGLVSAPTITIESGIADLVILSEVELTNPPAAKTCDMITKRKRRFGCSIGCVVLDWDVEEDSDDDWFAPVVIKHVYTVEWSVVGIPANQRCWVENAVYGLFSRSLAEGRGDDALRLAKSFQGLYSRDFHRLLNHVTSKGLCNDLARIDTRRTKHKGILWDFSKDSFFLRGPDNSERLLTRAQVADLLKRPSERTTMNIPTTTKAATGKTDWPLADYDTEWTGSKAEKQIFTWARNDDGDIVASKAKQGFLYCDPDNSDKQSGYKMPFCYVKGEGLEIVPKGVIECGNVLNGGMGGLKGVSAEDISAMKAKVQTMYRRINKEQGKDLPIPWEQGDEKSAEGEILDAENGEALIRQDLKERSDNMDKKEEGMPQAADVEVSSSGSHEPCTGSHTHAHKAFGSQGSDETHSHSHTHNGDADHNHDHDTEKSVQDGAEVVQKQIEDDPGRNALLTVYKSLLTQANTIGAQLGLEPVEIEQKCGYDAMTIQSVISMVSQADAFIDQAMSLLGIPDADKPQAGATYSLESIVLKGFENLLQKEGRELNEKNRGIIAMMHDHAKSLHDMAADMHPDCCKCGSGMQGDGTQHQGEGISVDEARQDAQYQMSSSLAQGMEHLSKAMEKWDVKQINDEVEGAKKELAYLARQFHQSRQELNQLNANMVALKNMPLGRPTQFNRSITNEASEADLRAMAGEKLNLKDVLAQTRIEEINGRQYRHWPAGVGTGVRPPLTSDQKSLMNMNWIMSYLDDGESYVPSLFDDPSEQFS